MEEDEIEELTARSRKRMLKIFVVLTALMIVAQIIGFVATQGGDSDHAVLHYENRIPNNENRFFCNFSLMVNNLVVKFTVFTLIVTLLLLLGKRPDFKRWLYITFNAILVAALFVGMVNSIMTPSVINRYCFVD